LTFFIKGNIIRPKQKMNKVTGLVNKNVLWQQLTSLFNNHPQDKKDQPPIITISREMGAGGRPIAYLVAKRLGRPWRVYHREIVDEMAKETNLKKELVKEVDEKDIKLLDEFVADLIGKRYLSLSAYRRHLLTLLAVIGKKGHAIIIGRGANYFFPHALKVRIICEMEQRIKWEMEYEDIPREEAIRRIEKSDKDRVNFMKALYQHDPRKAHHYDLVIRTGRSLSVEDAASLIVLAAKRRFKI
jgi:cytidylate kinase